MLIKVKNGLLRGEEREGIAAFKGIPYAKPPIGELRFKAPQPAKSWYGVRDATEFGAASVQPQMPAGGFKAIEEPISEDCLYLNVWCPQYAIREGQSLPVMVVIHGGGFQAFSGAYDILQGWELAKKDIVVVTINYRLGAMGFLAHPELSAEDPHHVSGNYAILDQIAALRWVRDNIAAFGGDPEKVTVSGESAGAFSVSVLCMSPLARGLFCRATAQSGGFFDKRTVMYQTVTLKEAEKFGKELFPGKSLAELRQMPAQELLALTASSAMQRMIPVRDGYIFPEDPYEVYKEKNFSDVPLLIGSNCDDGVQFTSCSGEADELTAAAAGLTGPDRIQEFCRIYPVGNSEETVRSQIQFISDSGFGHNMYVWAHLQEKYGESQVYLYYYCHVPPETDLGAYHSSELPYLFRNLKYRQKAWTEKDYELQDIYSEYLLNFVKYGDPNGKHVPEWKPFSTDTEQIMVLDDAPHMAENPTLAAMRFWDAVFEENGR